MSEHFQVGDIVERVGDLGPRGRRHGMVLGGLYTITSFCSPPWHPGETGLRLKEIELTECATHCTCWDWTKFRKIHRPRAEFLTELLSAPVDLTEDA